MDISEELQGEIIRLVGELIENESVQVSVETPLIGDAGLLDSMKLVELCLLLEDKAMEMGFEFDWTSEETLSRSRSMFRTVGALATEFVAQSSANK